MNLANFFEKLPRHSRRSALLRLAAAHGRPVGTVYGWIRMRNHPVTDKAMAITEAWSEYRVTRFDERPDVFDLSGIVKAMEGKGYSVVSAKKQSES